MAKRVDHDATQEVSASMLVPDKRPPAKPAAPANPPAYGNAPKNDASMWMQAPVSADDFMSAPRRKPVAPSAGGGRAVLVGVLVAAFVGVAGAGVYFAFLREPNAKSSSAASPPRSPPSPATPGSAATATVVSDAAVAVAAADAAAATADAGASAGVAGMKVDAISSADQPTKRSKKRATTKKKVVKKKTATAPKRRK